MGCVPGAFVEAFAVAEPGRLSCRALVDVIGIAFLTSVDWNREPSRKR